MVAVLAVMPARRVLPNSLPTRNPCPCPTPEWLRPAPQKGHREGENREAGVRGGSVTEGGREVWEGGWYGWASRPGSNRRVL